MTSEVTQALLPVTQADRDLYLALLNIANANQKLRFMGEPTIEPLQLIARHRLAHSRPSQADATSGETRLREALERIANDPYQHGQRVQKMKAIARAALTAPPTSDAGEARQAMLDTARQLRENSNGDPSAIQQAIAWERRAATLSPPTSGEEMRLREALLPCDVTVAPTTVFRAGVKVGTLLDCIEDRRAALTKGAE